MALSSLTVAQGLVNNAEFSANELTEVPPTLFTLTNLTMINLSYNKLTILPDNWSMFTALRVLDLTANAIETVPKSILELPELRVLKLDHNPIKLELTTTEVVESGLTLEVLRTLAVVRKYDAIISSRYLLFQGSLAILRGDTKENKLEICSDTRSIVVEAIDAQHGNIVAIKFYRKPDNGSNPSYKKLVDYTRAAGRFRHLHLLQYLSLPDTFDQLGDAFSSIIVMEVCDGTLFQLIHGSIVTITFEIARDLISQLVEGIAYLHGYNWAHRDLTPRNIFYMRSLRGFHIKIGDYAIGSLFACRQTSGTRGHSAPEIEWPADYGDSTLACDVFSVGMISWELLTGIDPSLPHLRDSTTGQLVKATDLMAHHMRDPITKKMLHSSQNDFDMVIRFSLQERAHARPFENFLLHMLRFDSGSRYPGAFSADTNNRLWALKEK